MPLHTQIIRDGKPLSLRWGDFHIAAMAVAASIDGPDKGLFKEEHTIDNPPPFGMPTWDVDSMADDELPCGVDRETLREWSGKDQTSYPDVPMPITTSDCIAIASYPMLGMTPLNDGPFTLVNRHRFIDCRDGEVLELLPGDVLVAGRH